MAQPKPLRYMTFNQDASRLGVGTEEGFATFTCEPFAIEKEYDNYPAAIVEIFFTSSLVAVVGAADREYVSPRVMELRNIRRDSVVTTLSYDTAILGVKFNRHRLVLLLENKIEIYDMHALKPLHTIPLTYHATKGLLALASNDDLSASIGKNILAFPSSNTIGSVSIFELGSEPKQLHNIQAHNGPIQSLALSQDGDRLATASEKGTVFRVYDTSSGCNLCELRRGSMYRATIQCLAFNADSSFLLASSDRQTVHIFSLSNINSSSSSSASSAQPPTQPPQPQTWGSYFASFVPSSVAAVGAQFYQERAYVTLALSKPGLHAVCAMTGGIRNTQVLVLADDAVLYKYQIVEGESGPACQLLQRHVLFPEEQDVGDFVESHAPSSDSDPSSAAPQHQIDEQ